MAKIVSLLRIDKLSRRSRRLTALTSALALVAVPTIWALFPWLSGIWILWRALILALWGVAAIVVVSAADRQATQVDEMMGEAERQRRKDRLKAGNVAISLLLSGSSVRTQGRCLDVYLPISKNLVKVAYSSESPLEPVEWNCPAGATGYAFTSGRRVVARGENARNDTTSSTRSSVGDRNI